MTVETQQKIYKRKVSAMFKNEEIKDLKKKNKDRQTNII